MLYLKRNSDPLAVQARLPKLAATTRNAGRSRGIAATVAGSFRPVLDGVFLLNHPFDPAAPEISWKKPLLVGWNEDEYTFFAMSGGDTSGFKLDFEGLRKKLGSRYGENTDCIIGTYRTSRPTLPAQEYLLQLVSQPGLPMILRTDQPCALTRNALL